MQQALMDEVGVFLDARHAELLGTIERLDALRTAVIRRDEAALTGLLDQAQQDAERKRQNDAAQTVLEQRLLDFLDGLSEPVTLSRVCELIEEDLRPPLRHKQTALQDLAHRVQRELDATEMLLRECARCNRELLAAIIGRNRQSLTYDPQGQSQWNVHHGLVSMKL
jgi:hypothetical protein